MSFLTRFLGRGEAAVTVPALDGGLKPNTLLDDLPTSVPAQAPDMVVSWQGELLWSEGTRLVNGQGIQVMAFDRDITALAASDTLLAVAMDDELLFLNKTLQDVTPNLNTDMRCITALAFGANALWVCSGSSRNSPSDWRRDLLEKNSTGAVHRVDPLSGTTRVVKSGLGYPSGIVVNGDKVAVSEAWRSQLVELDSEGRTQVLLDEIPGYPGRISARPGGYWLCVFAPRSPLIEFVLREPAYRKAMLKTVHPDHWVAPKYASGADFNEPMQGGALKQMGILKPWSPTLSYGLVVVLNEAFIPQFSYHSRAGGQRHGITAAVEVDGKLTLAGRGSDEILTLDLNGEEQV